MKSSSASKELIYYDQAMLAKHEEQSNEEVYSINDLTN